MNAIDTTATVDTAATATAFAAFIEVNDGWHVWHSIRGGFDSSEEANSFNQVHGTYGFDQYYEERGLAALRYELFEAVKAKTAEIGKALDLPNGWGIRVTHRLARASEQPRELEDGSVPALQTTISVERKFGWETSPLKGVKITFTLGLTPSGVTSEGCFYLKGDAHY